MNTPTQSLTRTASWVIVRSADNVAVFETFSQRIAESVNAKYRAVPILEYLQTLNRQIREAR